jgi:hypothetical protein
MGRIRNFQDATISLSSPVSLPYSSIANSAAAIKRCFGRSHRDGATQHPPPHSARTRRTWRFHHEDDVDARSGSVGRKKKPDRHKSPFVSMLECDGDQGRSRGKHVQLSRERRHERRDLAKPRCARTANKQRRTDRCPLQAARRRLKVVVGQPDLIFSAILLQAIR